MSLAPKNDNKLSNHLNWRPSAHLKTLKAKAKIIADIRVFFAARAVMEVETPVICQNSVTDPFIQSIPVILEKNTPSHYLQTSPEYAMKRLLAAGSGDIYQISKAFRKDEIGKQHNPEFTLLEWYRIGFNHLQLIDEVGSLIKVILGAQAWDQFSYCEIFNHFLNLDPHFDEIEKFKSCLKKHSIDTQNLAENDRDTWLNLLMSHCIEPHLGQDRPCFIYDFPASLAALSRVRPGSPPLASRFEVYVRGMELANGFHELENPNEQLQRFEKNILEREKHNLPAMEIDHYFLKALDHGLPDCSGVALGIDRLVMIATGCENIQEVISFDISRA